MHLCLAGMETKSRGLEVAVPSGVRAVLGSFAGVKTKEYGSWARYFEDLRRGEVEFILWDSGAFTFHRRAEERLPKAKRGQGQKYVHDFFASEIDAWLERYVKFLKECGHLLDGFFELDLGTENQKTEIRTRLEDAGFVPVPVFHSTDSQQYFDTLCSKYDYVALGNVSTHDYTNIQAAVLKAVGVAKKHKTRLHGLGLTQPEHLRKLGKYLFSVDSTYWLTGSMYGTTFEYRGGHRLVSHAAENKGNVRRRLKAKVVGAGLDFNAFLSEEAVVVHRWNALQWVEFEKWLSANLEKQRPFYWEAGAQSDDLSDDLEGDGGEDVVEQVMSPPYGGGCSVPGSTQPGEKRSLEERLAISEGKRGNLSGWKHGRKSNRLPSLFCDNCQVSETCQHYRKGSICTIPDEFRQLANQLDDPSPANVLQVLVDKAQRDLERWERAVAAESSFGGVLDKSVTDLSARLEKTLKLIAALQGRMDIVGGRRVINVTQQNLIIGGELSQTALILLKLPSERRSELLSSWQDNLATQRQILEEAGIDVAGISGLGGVASAGQVLAELEERVSAPPGVKGRPPGRVEGRGIRTIDGEARVVD